jgi:hypothetical protein
MTTSRWARRLLSAQSLYVTLPEEDSWQGRNDGTYFHATHSETASQLWVKRWRQGELTNAERCAAQAKLWRPDLARKSDAGAASRLVQAPAEYHTQVNVQLWSDDESWRGQLTANGASIRECFTYVYRTRAPRSPLGHAIVQQRLEVMQKALGQTATADTTLDVTRPQGR